MKCEYCSREAVANRIEADGQAVALCRTHLAADAIEAANLADEIDALRRKPDRMN